MRAALLATTAMLLAGAPAPAAPAYRIVGRPLVVFTRTSPGAPRTFTFSVFVRLDRPLRPARAAIVELDGARGLAGAFRATRRPPCYVAEIPNHNDPTPTPGLARPRDGQRMAVVVRLAGRDVARATVRARRVGGHDVGFDQANRRYLRRLGCDAR